MQSDHDVIGIGAMGSAALHSLAQRGLSVRGFEQFDLVHNHRRMDSECCSRAWHQDNVAAACAVVV